MELRTFGGRSKFEYAGSVDTGTKILFGTKGVVTITADQYSELRKYFKGRIVSSGTSRSGNEDDSIGTWLQHHVTRVAIASYVCAILINEKYAERIERHHIRVLK